MRHKLQLSSWSYGVLATLGLAGLGLMGCSSDSPSRVEAADWDPAAASDRAIAELDKNGDGQLSRGELAAAPGLMYCAKQLDTNADGQLSAEEILDRVREYKEMRVGLVGFTCQVSLDGRPLADAKVRLVPEPFLGAGLKTIESISQRGGLCNFTAEGINMSVAPVGMYRVEVTSSDVVIPAKYNTATTLGVVVSAITDPDHQGPVVFRLKQK